MLPKRADYELKLDVNKLPRRQLALRLRLITLLQHVFLLVCPDRSAGTFAEQVYGGGGGADEEDAPEDGRLSQGRATSE